MHFRFIHIVCILLLLGCKKETVSTTRICGHAGFGLNSSTSIYNENTQEAIQLCIDTKGTDGVEIDIQFSLNGTAWCFHDVELSEETNASGTISDKTDVELATFRYKNGDLNLCKLTQIPTDLWGKELFFDLREATKEGGVYQADSVIDRFINDCSIRFPNSKLSVIINTNLFVNKFKLNGFNVYFDAVSINDYYDFLGFSSTDGISISNELISEMEVQDLHQLNKKVLIFGARSPKYIRKALKKNADIFLADDINATLIERFK